MKKLIPSLLIFALLITGCTKYEPIQPTCQRVYCLSDRYSYDTVYLRTDTIWPFGRYHNEFCGSDTLKFVNNNRLLLLCADSTYELVRYVIGDEITEPYIFK